MDNNQKVVIIIGAGAAGIGASRTLQDKTNMKVIVLESRDRIGGRVHRVKMTKNLINSHNDNSTININIGANWIHNLRSKQNPLYKVSQQLGYKICETSADHEPGEDILLFDSIAHNDQGNYKVISKEVFDEARERYEHIQDIVEEMGNGSKLSNQPHITSSDINGRQAFDLAMDRSKDSQNSMRNGVVNRCVEWFLDRIAIDLAADLDAVSLASYTEGAEYDREGLMLDDGSYTGILEHIIHHPSNIDIRLGHEVKVVTTSSNDCDDARKDGKVSVECSNGEVFTADACIVTLPISVLQLGNVQFIPHPPTRIQQLTSSLEMGTMNLIWLWYPSIYWPVQYNYIGVAHEKNTWNYSELGIEDIVSSSKHDNKIFTTFLAPCICGADGNREAIIMCQVWGIAAQAIESLSESDVALRVTKVLRSMFGDDRVPDAIGCMRSQWYNDPYSKGSWSMIPYINKESNQCIERDWDNGKEGSSVALEQSGTKKSKVVDSVVAYAGEADSVVQRGTVHGAYLSGIKAANRIIKALH